MESKIKFRFSELSSDNCRNQVRLVYFIHSKYLICVNIVILNLEKKFPG